MTFKSPRLWLAVAALVAVSFAVACGGDDDEATATVATSATVEASATAAATDTPAPTETPAATATPEPVDPCSLRDSLEGQPLVDGPSFVLGGAGIGWQLCIGGAAAGSSEKYLYGSTDDGETWTLLSMTTLGNPPPEAGVGELPNGNAAEALYFVDADTGWLGLSSPGVNLFGTTDGGVSWTAADDLPPGLPVTAIEFSDADNGVATTPEGDWTTSDGGATWSVAP